MIDSSAIVAHFHANKGASAADIAGALNTTPEVVRAVIHAEGLHFKGRHLSSLSGVREAARQKGLTSLIRKACEKYGREKVLEAIERGG